MWPARGGRKERLSVVLACARWSWKGLQRGSGPSQARAAWMAFDRANHTKITGSSWRPPPFEIGRAHAGEPPDSTHHPRRRPRPVSQKEAQTPHWHASRAPRAPAREVTVQRLACSPCQLPFLEMSREPSHSVCMVIVALPASRPPPMACMSIATTGRLTGWLKVKHDAEPKCVLPDWRCEEKAGSTQNK